MKKFKKSRLSFDEKIASSKFDYCKNLKWFLIAPIVLIIVGVVLLFTVGFNLGMDFTGGSIMKVYANNGGEIVGENVQKYDTSKNADYAKMQDIIDGVLAKHGLKASVYQTTTMDIEQLDVYEGQAVQVKYQNIENASSIEIEDTNNQIRQELAEAFGYNNITFGEFGVASVGTVTPSASSELLMNSFIAMLVALALILVYVALRFEITSGFATILALFHDLLVTTAFMLIFRIQINASFVAALVTILGYSINNTIVIFDRIRENQRSGKYDDKPNEVVANASVKETMTRSVFTTLTTFVTIALVAIIGVSDIREFAIPIVIGILAGFYSSVFLTPGLWAIAFKPSQRLFRRRQKKAEDKKQKDLAV